MMKIEFSSTPKEQDIALLSQGINQEIPDYQAPHPFAFFIYEENGEMIAGANGSVIFGAIYTEQLWVHSKHRKKGLASQLMEEIHQYGRKEGCQLATVTTMSFQDAQVFYEKLGYTVDFERPGYIDGAKAIFLRKKL